MDHFGESVSAEDDLSLGNSSCLIDIIISWHLSFLNGWIDASPGVIEGFLGPHLDVHFTGLLVSDVVLLHKHNGSISKVLPVAVTEWKVSVSGKLVSDGVPNGVQVSCSLAVWQVDRITSAIALRVLGVNSGGGVQWLMKVADVVDDEPHGG